MKSSSFEHLGLREVLVIILVLIITAAIAVPAYLESRLLARQEQTRVVSRE